MNTNIEFPTIDEVFPDKPVEAAKTKLSLISNVCTKTEYDELQQLIDNDNLFRFNMRFNKLQQEYKNKNE